MSVKAVGGPPVLTREEEELVCDVAQQYIDAAMLLIRQDMLDMVQDVYRL